jgi:hypothetical protein
METQLINAYRAERVVHTAPVMRGPYMQSASHALNTARVKLAWKAADGYECDDNEDAPDHLEPGRVRLAIVPDYDSPPDDFCGTEADLAEARERARREGMSGIVGQFWNGSEWEEADSVYGFIGEDWRGSGYDVDVMSAALKALARHDEATARAFEAQAVPSN